MTNKTYITEAAGFRVEVAKVYRTGTQYEWVLNIFFAGTNIESHHLFKGLHLTKKEAFKEANRAIFVNAPRITRIA